VVRDGIARLVQSTQESIRWWRTVEPELVAESSTQQITANVVQKIVEQLGRCPPFSHRRIASSVRRTVGILRKERSVLVRRLQADIEADPSRGPSGANSCSWRRIGFAESQSHDSRLGPAKPEYMSGSSTILRFSMCGRFNFSKQGGNAQIMIDYESIFIWKPKILFKPDSWRK
jgi:hypothetical protein